MHGSPRIITSVRRRERVAGEGEKSRLPELLRERNVRDRDLNEARENAGGKSPGGEERKRDREREREKESRGGRGKEGTKRERE